AVSRVALPAAAILYEPCTPRCSRGVAGLGGPPTRDRLPRMTPFVTRPWIQTVVLIALSLALLLAASPSDAHEEEHVRYMMPGGADTGGCETPATACRTVGYTAGQAGKGGEVKVAAGQYT